MNILYWNMLWLSAANTNCMKMWTFSYPRSKDG